LQAKEEYHINERFLLFTRKQKEEEKVDEYVKVLRSLAETCEYGQLKCSIIKDAFVIGINDNKLRENLLKDCELSLENAINIARASEKAREQSDMIRGEPTMINKIEKNKTTRNKVVKDCRFCGSEHEMKAVKCPAFGKSCNKCNKQNHFCQQMYDEGNPKY